MVKVRMVLMSHLSDVQEMPNHGANNSRIEFVKYLLMKFNDTDTLIDADAEFDKFHTERMSGTPTVEIKAEETKVVEIYDDQQKQFHAWELLQKEFSEDDLTRLTDTECDIDSMLNMISTYPYEREEMIQFIKRIRIEGI